MGNCREIGGCWCWATKTCLTGKEERTAVQPHSCAIAMYSPGMWCFTQDLASLLHLVDMHAGCATCAHKDQIIGSLQKQVYDLQARLAVHEAPHQPAAPPQHQHGGVHLPHMPHPLHLHQHQHQHQHHHGQPAPSLPPRHSPHGTCLDSSPSCSCTCLIAHLDLWGVGQVARRRIPSPSTCSTPPAPRSPTTCRRCAFSPLPPSLLCPGLLLTERLTRSRSHPGPPRPRRSRLLRSLEGQVPAGSRAQQLQRFARFEPSTSSRELTHHNRVCVCA